MKFQLIGINHKTAPVEVRERLAIPESRLPEACKRLAEHPAVSEGMIVSTCNRVEFIATMKNGSGDLREFMREYFDTDLAEFESHLYEFREDEAVRHVFAVAKRVRTETAVGSSSVSIASVAVELAKKIFGSLNGKSVYLVGAGKMSELAARHLMAHGAASLFVANSTSDRAI